MNFLIDAQLPRRMVEWFGTVGIDAIHTLDLPERNSTSDTVVAATADNNDRVVVTKDADFVDSHLLRGTPARLLLISTGNISNDELQSIMVPMIGDLVREFNSCAFIELTRTELILRG